MVLKNAALAGLVLFALLFRIDLCAQLPFAEIDLSSNNIDDIQAFEAGDSILLTYSDKREIKGHWIDREGSAFEIQFPISATLPLCDVTQRSGNTYVYYLHKVENQLTLKILEQRQGSLSMTPYPFMAILEDEVVVAQSRNNRFFLITYRKPSNEIKVSVLEGTSIVHEHIFAMPTNLARYLKYSAGIMNERFATIEQGSGRLKFYVENNELVLTLDNMLDGQDSKTTIMWTNLATGTTETSEIHSPEYVRFSSFYYKNQLFRFVRKHDAVFVNIHRADTGDTLYSKTMTKKETVDAQKIFQRVGKTRRIEYRNFYPMYSADSELSILVEPIKKAMIFVSSLEILRMTRVLDFRWVFQTRQQCWLVLWCHMQLPDFLKARGLANTLFWLETSVTASNLSR